MKKKSVSKTIRDAKYYDKRGVLSEIVGKPVEMSLETGFEKALSQVKEREDWRTFRLRSIHYKYRPSRKSQQ